MGIAELKKSIKNITTWTICRRCCSSVSQGKLFFFYTKVLFSSLKHSCKCVGPGGGDKLQFYPIPTLLGLWQSRFLRQCGMGDQKWEPRGAHQRQRSEWMETLRVGGHCYFISDSKTCFCNFSLVSFYSMLPYHISKGKARLLPLQKKKIPTE